MLFGIRKTIFMTVLAALAVALFAPTAFAGSKSLDISTLKAPVAPDGTTAGAATDFIVNFKDLDPAVKGVSLRAGATIELVLPSEFTPPPMGSVAPNFGVILQGWPQSPPAPPPSFIWMSEVIGNTIKLTLTENFKVGQFGPGAKQLHLILLGFTNPANPGVYPVKLTIKPKPGKGKILRGTGNVRIIPDARPSVNPISLFSGPPGPPPPFFNPIYQTLGLGEPARRVGLYLWDADNEPSEGVDVSPTANPTYYQLHKASMVVGEVWINAPNGANAYSLSSVELPVGDPPSVVVPAFVTEIPVGLLGVQFTPDPGVTGDYEIAISMFGGNESTLFVTVEDDDDDSDSDSDSDK